MIKEPIDKIIGINLGNRKLSMFVEIHPLFWALGYLSFDSASAITVGCFTVGIEY